MTRTVAVTTLALCLLCCVGSAFAGTVTAKSGSYELTLTTTPGAQNPDVITCTAVMKNTTTNEVLAASKTTFRAGQPAQVQSKSEHSTFELTLKSDLAKNQATAECQYSLNGELVFAPKVTFDLR